MGLEAVAIGLSAASALSGVVGTVAQASAQSQQAKYNQQVAENNAKVAEMNRNKEMLEAQREAERIRLKGQRVQGSARAKLGVSGIDPLGSALDVLQDNLIENEMDALNAEYRGQIGAFNSNVTANRYRSEARLEGMKAKSYQSAGILGGIGAGLSGASSTYNTYLRLT